MEAIRFNGIHSKNCNIPAFDIEVGQWYNFILASNFLNDTTFIDSIGNSINLFERNYRNKIIDLNYARILNGSGNLLERKLKYFRNGLGKGKKIVFFDIGGLSPTGVDKLYTAINENIGDLAVIEFFYPMNQDIQVFKYVKVFDFQGAGFDKNKIKASSHVQIDLGTK